MMNEQYASDSQYSRWIASYTVYIAIMFAMTITVMTCLNGPFVEHVSRNWMLSLVLVTLPATNNPSRSVVHSILIGIVPASLVYFGQTYITYEYLGYDSSGSISNHWLLAAIVYYSFACFISWFVTKRFVFSGFRITPD